MEQIVFPVPQICEFLTEESKTMVYTTCERDDQNSKASYYYYIIQGVNQGFAMTFRLAVPTLDDLVFWCHGSTHSNGVHVNLIFCGMVQFHSFIGKYLNTSELKPATSSIACKWMNPTKIRFVLSQLPHAGHGFVGWTRARERGLC